MKIAGFDWDVENWPKCGKHGLSKMEIESIFRDVPVSIPTRSRVRNGFGQSGATRMADIFCDFHIAATAAGILIRPLSARYMHKKEIAIYEQQKGA